MSEPQRAESDIATATPAQERVPLGTVLAYGPPIFGASWMLFFVQFFYLKYAADVLLISPAVVGAIFALGRLWDAVTDPLAGVWSDRTRSRLGRRRPWMFGAIPLVALSFVLVYSPPSGLVGGGLLVWVTVALFSFYTGLTGYMVPHQALGAELTEDHHDRSRIFGLRHAFFTLGMMMAFGGMQYVNNASDPRSAAAGFAVAVGVSMGLLMLVTPARVRERTEFQGRGGQSPVRAMRDVLQNPHARLLLAVQFIEMAGAGVLGVLAPFMMQYVLKRPDLIGPLPAVFVICSVLSIPVWVMLSRRFGKRNVWIVAMVGVAFGFGASGLVQPGDWVWMSVCLVVAGISMGCGGAVGPSILADVIDYDEYQSGERKEGAYSAAWGFAIKAANAGIVLIVGIVLELTGFEPNAEQSKSAEYALRAMQGGIPFVLFLVGAFFFRRFALNEAEHARIRAVLDARRAQS